MHLADENSIDRRRVGEAGGTQLVFDYYYLPERDDARLQLNIEYFRLIKKID